MAEIVKFPDNGYEVTIIRKQDVLDCIDNNIIDKEIALDLISKLEVDAASVLNAGFRANIPFLGTIQVKRTMKLLNTKEVKDNIIAAREVLDRDAYIMFRKKLAKDVALKASYDKYYTWCAKSAVSKNLKRFKELASKKGEAFARFYLYSLTKLCAIDNEVIYLQDGNE